MERKKSALELLNSKKPPTKAVINPSAQFTTLCTSDNLTGARAALVCGLFALDSSLCTQDKAILELMFISGCRISEALSICSNDILKNGSIRLKGSKKSSDRIISIVLYRTFWLSNRTDIRNLFYSFNRFYYYRLFKKHGLSFLIPGKLNMNVTHSLRQLYIESMNEGNISNELIKTTIGHKSINSQEYYKLNGKKKAKK